MSHIIVGERRIYYECSKDLTAERIERPVLLVHGACDNHRLWHYVYPRLAQTHTPVAIDLPGRGGSQGPPINDATAHLAFFEELIDTLKLPRPFIFAGHSVGGSIGLDYAFHHPDQVRALILVSAAPSWGIQQEEIDLWKTDPDRAYTVNSGYLYSQKTSHGLRDSYDQQLRTTPPDSCLADLQTCDSFHLEDHLASITAPALVICGTEEYWLDGSHTLYKTLPNAQLELVPDAGHAIALEQPQALNTAIDNFLAALS